ncbi:DNA polymerase I [Leifsonia xyli subsp. cynodontis DSM 46306]|uniref:Holin n=1 Tax=Leifsonia xyli subsp. cynodontis DSM 46306 TaxID=1389489 RepID=U3PCH2_LEIXC|nr:hypothetical protein [Leifsonia xyli]AGW42447.1 DNA polymerase I [Leifsonia xyli subsp. cynodontis DSM 46306]
MNNLIPNPATRAWIYRILIATAATAVSYNLITPNQSNLWLTLIAAILGLSNTLALTNTPTTGKHSTSSSGEDSGT